MINYFPKSSHFLIRITFKLLNSSIFLNALSPELLKIHYLVSQTPLSLPFSFIFNILAKEYLKIVNLVKLLLCIKSFCDSPLLFVVVVEPLSCVQLFETPPTITRQAPLSFTISQSSFKLVSIESVMPSNRLILCHPLHLLPSVFPSIRVFSNSRLFASGGHSIGASASVLPMNSQG